MAASICLFWVTPFVWLPLVLLVRVILPGRRRMPSAQETLAGLGMAMVGAVVFGMMLQSWHTGVIDLPRRDVVYRNTPGMWWFLMAFQALLLAMLSVLPIGLLVVVPRERVVDTATEDR